jgi:hypothetical protein
MKLKSKRTFVLIGVLAGAVFAAVGAYAYWTATGSGEGSATVGTSANKLYVRGTADSTALTPGGPGSVITFAAWNFASNDESISNIHLTSVRACDVPWTYGSTASYPVPGATCGGTELSTADCGTFSDGSAANPAVPVADFYMADRSLNPATDGNILANASGQAIAPTALLKMNNVASDNQNPCKSQYLLLAFSTS